MINVNNQDSNNLERTLGLVVGGALLISGLRRGNRALRILAAVAGGALLLRASAGHLGVAKSMGATEEDADQPTWKRSLHVRKTITIMRPREEVYRFWRKFENLPKFMRHLIRVEEETERLSHWVARGPAGKEVRWDAEVTVERENEVIAWRSLSGSEVENSGEVLFEDAPGGRGTVVRVMLAYCPPAGVLGAVVAKLFSEEPEGQIADDLRRLRSLLETGEVPTIEGQPSDIIRKTKGLLGTRLFGPGMSDDEMEEAAREARTQ